MSTKHDSVVELLRKWVRSTRADGLGPLGTNLKELEEIADMVEAEIEAEREETAFFKAERNKLEDEVEELTEQLDDYDCETYRGGSIVDWYELSGRLQVEVDELREKTRWMAETDSRWEAMRRELERTIAERDACYMKLPVDANGVPIRPGDMMQFKNDAPVRVDSIGNSRCYEGDFGWFGDNGGFYGMGTLSQCRHIKHDTVESVLQELADEVWNASCESQTTWSDSGLNGIAERYAERIRKAVHDD